MTCPLHMKMNRALAIIVTIAVPFGGAGVGLLAPELALRTCLLCIFPLLLISKPPFIKSYFGEGAWPVVLGWLAFAAIFIQAFLFPILFRLR